MTKTDSDVIIAKLDGMKELMEEKFNTNDKAHKHLSDALHKKANKWTELVIKFGLGAVGVWMINQILNLIPKVQTAYYYITTIT